MEAHHGKTHGCLDLHVSHVFGILFAQFDDILLSVGHHHLRYGSRGTPINSMIFSKKLTLESFFRIKTRSNQNIDEIFLIIVLSINCFELAFSFFAFYN